GSLQGKLSGLGRPRRRSARTVRVQHVSLSRALIVARSPSRALAAVAAVFVARSPPWHTLAVAYPPRRAHRCTLAVTRS
ncbi:hypothetical protein EXIGLDRAFT_847921, partial [Exidia glandulosa HHB12029]